MRPLNPQKIGSVEGGVLLPVRIKSTVEGYDGGAALRDAGVVFHEPLADYPVLRLVTLPAGWKVTSNYGTNLVDDKNRVRATTVHDESYYHPFALMTVACPFIISFRTERDKKRGGRIRTIVGRIRMRHGDEIMAMPPVTVKRVRRPNNKWGGRVYKLQATGKMKAEKVAFLRQWLDETLPGWQTQSKYWDYKAQLTNI